MANQKLDSIGTVIAMPTPQLIVDAAAPYETAGEFVRRRYLRGTTRTLRQHQGAFYAWNGKRYAELDERSLRSELYELLNDGVTLGGKVPFKPKKAGVTELVDALKAAVHLDPGCCAPAWLGAAPVPAEEILACQNGLLHLPSGQLLPHTPEFFSHNVLDFDYSPHAPPPRQWLEFLNSLWADDAESINLLQELFGLCLTADTHYQKAFMVIGPPRSGKGTIIRVLTRLIGQTNVVAPTLSSLAEQFGPATLIGKRVACIADARIGRRADPDKIAERLLSITGEDLQSIDRKYGSHWTGRLQVRFIISSNELPKFEERSGALAGRFVILEMRRSFVGREDLKLIDKLLPELPGILNWSITGWDRLTKRGYFKPPETGRELASELENLSSPIKMFVKECCVLGSNRSVAVETLYKEWCEWNVRAGNSVVPPSNLFSRDLHAAFPQIRVAQLRRDGRARVFIGIGLQSKPA
jgi:putative DNA primase/helicase